MVNQRAHGLSTEDRCFSAPDDRCPEEQGQGGWIFQFFKRKQVSLYFLVKFPDVYMVVTYSEFKTKQKNLCEPSKTCLWANGVSSLLVGHLWYMESLSLAIVLNGVLFRLIAA